MSFQAPIRDRERGLRGPGLSVADKSYFDGRVSDAEAAAVDATTKADEAATSAANAATTADTRIAAYDLSRLAIIWPDDPLKGGSLTVNDSGEVLSGVLADGRVYGKTAETLIVWPDDPYYGTGATVNDDGMVLSGQALEASALDALAVGVLGDGNVWAVGPDASVRLSDPVGTAYNPQLRDSTVYWVDGTSYRSMDLDALSDIPGSITKLVMVPLLGQSLAASFSDSGMTALTTNAAARTYMFTGGTVPIQDAKLDAQPVGLAEIDDRQLAGLVPLVEKVRRTTAPSAGYGESMGGGLAAVLAAARPANEAIVFASFAVGSTTISQLGATSYPFQNMIRGIERIAAWCKLKGIAFDCPVMAWLQGEGNIADNTSPATYSTSLLALQGAFKTAVDAAVGTVTDRPIVLLQPGSASFYAKTNILPASLMDVALANPTKVKVAGGLYHQPNYATGGVHMTSLGYRRTGEEFGRAIAQVIAEAEAGTVADADTGALYVTAAGNAAMTLTITTSAATQLVQDTATVTDPGQSGLVLRKVSDGTTVALSSIAVSGTNQITAALAGALEAGAQYQLEVGQNLASVTPAGSVFAGPTTGYRACFRDSSPDTYSATGGGGAMRRWIAYQAFTFTAS